jgi:hypothetical protein
MKNRFTENYARYTLFGCGIIVLRSQHALDVCLDHDFPIHTLFGCKFGISIFGWAK